MQAEKGQKEQSRSMVIALDGIHRNAESGTDTLIHILASFAAREIARDGELQIQRAMERLKPFGFELKKNEHGYRWEWGAYSGGGPNAVLVLADALERMIDALLPSE